MDIDQDNEQQKLVIINKVFPNAFDEEEFSRTKNSFLEQWKRSYSTIISTDSVERNLHSFKFYCRSFQTSDQYWIIFDLNGHSNWLTWDRLQYISQELFSSLSRQNGRIDLLWRKKEKFVR